MKAVLLHPFQALSISRSLLKAKIDVQRGQTSVTELRNSIIKSISEAGGRIDYAEVRKNIMNAISQSAHLSPNNLDIKNLTRLSKYFLNSFMQICKNISNSEWGKIGRFIKHEWQRFLGHPW